MNWLVQVGKQGQQLSKEIALPPPSTLTILPLHGDERAATYSYTPVDRGGQKSVQLNISFSQGPLTMRIQYDGQGDIFGSTPHPST